MTEGREKLESGGTEMKHRLLNLAALASVVLCLATGALWLHSLDYADILARCSRSGPTYTIATHPHGFSIGSDSTFAALVASRVSDEPRWMVRSIPYNIEQLRLVPRAGKLAADRSDLAERADMRFVLRRARPTGGFLGFRCDDFGGVDVEILSFDDGGLWVKGSRLAALVGASGKPASSWRLAVPFWFVVCATLVLPLVQFRRAWRRHRRWVRGHCLECGYDLRATPERCPECGTEAKREY